MAEQDLNGLGASRRQALKAAAAAGVGAAAWVAPNVSTLGFAPAYAAQGSPTTVTLTQVQGLQATNNGACVNWGQAGSQPKTFTIDGPEKVTVDLTASSSGVCIDHSNGTPMTTITAQPPSYTCSITGIAVSCGSGGSGPDAGPWPTFPTGTTTVEIPACPGGTSANSFIFYTFTCEPNP